MKDSGGLYRSTAIMASATFLSRVLGLVREQVFAFLFGASTASDAFQMAFRIPNLLRDLFAEGAMSSALVPVYARIRHERGEEEAWDWVRNVVTTLGLLLAGVALLGIALSPSLVRLFASGYQAVPGKLELTVAMTRLLWPFLPFVGLAAVWMGLLNARERFGVPALAPTWFNLMSIGAAFTLCPLASQALGYPAVYGWAVGATLGGLFQWLFQIPALRREGFRFHWRLRLNDPRLREMVILMAAGTFGLAATQVNVLVNSILASSEPEGAVSWLYYAFRLMQFPIGVFGVAISTANFSRVSREAAVGNLAEIRNSVRDSLCMVIVLTIPSAVGLAVLGIPIVSVIYEHGLFTAQDTYFTSLALAAYSLGLTAYAGVRVMVPVLYSVGRSRLAVWSSGLGMLLNVILCFALVRVWGFVGLAAAMSCAALLNGGVLLWMLEREIKQIEFNFIGVCAAKTLFASLFMAIIVYVFLGFLDALPFRPIPLTGVWDKANFAAQLLYLSVAIALGLCSFLIVAKLVGLRELVRLQELIWKRLRARRERA